MPTNRFFPFYELGFECNPFRALSDEEWVEVVVVPPQVQLVLDQGFVNLQILGEAGFGKTTMLLHLTRQVGFGGGQVAYERIPEDGRSYQTPLVNLDCFLLDEAQRLEKEERKRLLNQSQSLQLIIASHENLESLFADNNRPIVTINLDQTGPDHLMALLNKRLTYFSLDGHRPELFSQETVDFLWGKFGRNIRAVEQYLYERFQQMIIGRGA